MVSCIVFGLKLASGYYQNHVIYPLVCLSSIRTQHAYLAMTRPVVIKVDLALRIGSPIKL